MKKLIQLGLIAILLVATCTSGFAQNSAVYRSKGFEYPLRHILEEGIIYLSLTDLAAATGCNLKWYPVEFKAQMILGDDDLVVPMFSRYVRFEKELLNITYPAVYRQGDIYVPAVTFLPALEHLIPLSLFWDEDFMTLRAEESSFNVIDINFESKANGFLIELVLRDKLPYEAYVTEQKWININVFGGTLDERLFRTVPRPKVVRQVRAFQFEESCQIAVRFYRSITKFSHNFTTNPPRIQIAIIDTSFDPLTIDTMMTEGADIDPIDVVIIDAGHGGQENGAQGPRGTKEKDITLGVAQKLRELLSADPNLTVVLTRDADTTVTLQERADIANSNAGDLYVSIHCNAFEDDEVSGSQTFFLAAAMNDEARATAMLENRSVMLEREDDDEMYVDDLDFILLDLMQTEYLSESQDLAKTVQSELGDALNIKSRGVDQAGFFVLNKVFMPSVLVEIAFISNKKDEALLKKDSFQQKAAEAIHKGIRRFIEKYNSYN